MENLDELKKSLLADGKIDKEEVEQLRTVLYADGVIDAEEVAFLFELNDAVSGENNAPEWKEFFVEAISDNILADGEIDEEEVKMLSEKIGADGQVDETEEALLLNLKAKAKNFPAALDSLLK